VTEEATSSVNTTEVMGWFRPSPPDRSVVLSSAESEVTEGEQAKEGVSYDARIPVKPAGGMLLWMSRPGEALLGGLSGGAQHAGDGGPGGVVLPGADHSGLQLFLGVDQVLAGVGEQGDGVGFSGRRAAARLAFAEGAALCVAR
jgi:hypothetical protein